jgi:protein farnesyltransferase/geranylgeranyltransferase type-1 subunit alpha
VCAASLDDAEQAGGLIPVSLADTSAMSTFRYILSQQELSKRVLELTGEIVKMNPAHYTVW